MFPRVTEVKAGDTTYKYLRIVESYRDDRGRMRQRIVAQLGRLDVLQAEGKLDSLVEKLRRFCNDAFVLPKEIANRDCFPWGPVLLARRLWQELGLGDILEKHCQGKHAFNVAERAFVLVLNRLCDPRSEHGLARWLESLYVCDKEGRRWLPAWRPVEEVTPDQRVRVTWEWLDPWYRTLDAVYGKKAEIEKELFLHLRDLLSLKVDLVFYDVTSLYFERREPKGKLRRHGYSRDGKPRNVQVLLGVVMVGGFPIASHVFSGDRNDKTTVQEVVKDIDARLGLKDIIFVGDKGMTSPDNVSFLDSVESYHYILGHPGRRDDEAKAWLKAIKDDRWVEGEKRVKVQEVKSGKEGLRVVLVESAERMAYEVQMRQRSMARAEAHLKKVQAAVEKGQVKQPDKIAARAERALQKDKGYRYFTYRVPGKGQFEYQVDPQKLEDEVRHEGRYILTTSHPHLDPREVSDHYKELSDTEDGFRQYKDVLEGRPVYHQRDERVCAHLFIAQLALILLRHLRGRLKKEGIYLSAADAIKAMHSLGVAILDLNGSDVSLVGGGSRDAKRVLNALKIENLKPLCQAKKTQEKSTM